jgi:hypothetical protein
MPDERFPTSERYKSHGLSADDVRDIQEFRERFIELSNLIESEEMVSNPRYRALALTHLETAAMFATKMLSHRNVK